MEKYISPFGLSLLGWDVCLSGLTFGVALVLAAAGTITLMLGLALELVQGSGEVMLFRLEPHLRG